MYYLGTCTVQLYTRFRFSLKQNIKFYFRIIIGPRLRRLAGDVFVVPRFSDSVAPIGAAFKQTRTREKVPRVPPDPRRGGAHRCLVILAGGEPPPARQGLGLELLREFRPDEQADATLVCPHQHRTPKI